MPLPPAELRDRFRASVLGFAVGDALGFPNRGTSAAAVALLPGLAEDFAPRPRGRFARGQFSDDTQMLLAVAESIARERRVDGRSAALHLRALWQEGIVLEPATSATAAAQRLLQGVPWMSAGAPIGVCDASGLSRAVAVGLWDAGNPARIPHDASVLAVITHKDPVCAAAAAALGRAVSIGLEGEPWTADYVCEEMARAAQPCEPSLAGELSHLPRIMGWEPARALGLLRRVGVPQEQLTGDGLPAHVVPTLLTAVFSFFVFAKDFRAAVANLLACGGEADVAAGVCGALIGAHLGSDAIPARLRRNVQYADSLTATADRLYAARSAVGGTASAVAVARARRGGA